MVMHHLVMHLLSAMPHPSLVGLMRLVVLVLDHFGRYGRGLVRPGLRRRERDKRSDGGDDQARFARKTFCMTWLLEELETGQQDFDPFEDVGRSAVRAARGIYVLLRMPAVGRGMRTIIPGVETPMRL